MSGCLVVFDLTRFFPWRSHDTSIPHPHPPHLRIPIAQFLPSLFAGIYALQLCLELYLFRLKEEEEEVASHPFLLRRVLAMAVAMTPSRSRTVGFILSCVCVCGFILLFYFMVEFFMIDLFILWTAHV